jgi:ribA/ribD-fused uncharacterized protein
MAIIAFTKTKEDYGWMSNMSAHLVRYKGEWFPTAEHLFQFMRYEGMKPILLNNKRDAVEWVDEARIKKEILETANPLVAKKIAQKYRKLWTTTKEHDIAIMNKVVRWKLAFHSEFIRMLIATGDETIIEDASDRASGSGKLWGAALQEDGTWDGENNLGHIWMKVREDLKQVLIL